MSLFVRALAQRGLLEIDGELFFFKPTRKDPADPSCHFVKVYKAGVPVAEYSLPTSMDSTMYIIVCGKKFRLIQAAVVLP